MRFIPVLAVILISVSAAPAKGPTLKTLDGQNLPGQIVSVDGVKVVFKTATGDVTYEMTKLYSIEIADAPKPGDVKGIEVELLDGSQFKCSDFRIRGKNAVLTLVKSGQTVEFPANTILYMVRDLGDPKLAQAFREILAKRGKRDIWIVNKGESLDGLAGTFGDGDAEGKTISFESEATAERINIQMSRVYGMIFNPPAMAVAQTVCKVVDTQGNVLYAKSVKIAQGQKVAVESVTGVKVEYPQTDSIAQLDFSAGSMLYLSNADPVKVEQSSTEGIPEPYRRDRNLDNSDLKINGVKYPKGLAVHSRTVLTYKLDGKYKLFQAIAGVDDCVEGDSKVLLTIEADFKPVLREVVKKGDQPKQLNLSMLNVKELRITVDSEFLDLGNQLNLVDAKVMK